MTRYALALAWAVGLAAVGLADDADKAVKELDGEYEVKVMIQGGQPAPDEVVKSLKAVTIKGGVLTVTVGDETLTAKLVVVDAAKKPPHLDMTMLDGPEKDATLPGLYKLEKTELTLVVTEPGHDRPTTFDAKGEKEKKLVLTRKGK